MKKMVTAAALLGLSLPVMAQALEFQTPGALGMGRAGVARTTDSYATFINPAGLAFYQKSFSMNLGAGVGVAISSSLADNVDKIGKLELDKLSYTTTGNQATDTANALASTAQAVQALAIVDDLSKRDGTLTVNVDAALAFQYRNVALGIGNVSEIGANISNFDRGNLRTGTSGPGAATAAANFQSLVTDLNGGTPPPATVANTQTYFSQTQWESIITKIQTAMPTITQGQAATLANKVGTQLGTPGTDLAGLTKDQIISGIDLAAASFNGGSLDNNKTTVSLTGISLFEVPLSYGHKFDFGPLGQLGVGATAKVMRGTVYSTEALLFKDFQGGSNDFTKRAKDNKTDSTTFGIDLGALWRMEDVKFIGPVSVGLVAKNLNSPTFDGPVVNGVATKDIKVEPQIRAGIGLDPLSWLSIAADVDFTKNKTVLPGRDSQLIGGGLEAHFDNWYALWLALRAGLYKNIGEDGSKPVITAGLSLGPQWLRLDINGAFATEKARYDNKSYPNEAKVEFGLSTAF